MSKKRPREMIVTVVWPDFADKVDLKVLRVVALDEQGLWHHLPILRTEVVVPSPSGKFLVAEPAVKSNKFTLEQAREAVRLVNAKKGKG